MHLILLLLALAGAPAQPAPPSHIFHNGKIVTVDEQFRIVQAMAIRDGRVVAVGSNAEIRKLAGQGTAQVDLGGKTVLPGLIDSHVHAPAASMYEFEGKVPDMASVADVLAYISGRAKTTEPKRWITLSQVFITRLKEQRYPTRVELDKAAPQNPVAFRTGPDASLNSMALGDERDRRAVQGPRGTALPRRARRRRQADGHPAQLRQLHPLGSGRQLADQGGPPLPPPRAARRLQLGRHHRASSTPTPARKGSSSIRRCSTRMR